MAVADANADELVVQRSIWTTLNQIFGPLLQILLFTIGSAVSLSIIVLLLALLVGDSSGQENLVQRTLILLPQVIVDSLVRGFLYAMIALGYTMVYGVLEFINFAHGEIFMVGAIVVAGLGYILESYGLIDGTPAVLYVLVAVLLGMLVSGTLAVVTERVAYRHLRGSPRLVLLVSTIGMSLFLQDLVRAIMTSTPLTVNARVETPDFGEALTLMSLTLPDETPLAIIIDIRSLIFIIASVIMLIGLNYLVNVTKVGKAIRAVAQDRSTASLMGVNVNNIIAITFLVGGALGGAAGALFGIRIGTVNPYIGFIPGLKAFTAAVLGGIGNITGAMVGGIVLGFLETYVASYLSPLTGGEFAGANYADIAAFSILIIILIFRPEGLLGEATTQKV
jgi:branched-chain amino acid transport system permease protein